MRLYRHLSVFLFAAVPVCSFKFWWCSALSPFGVEPPALPCGLAWGLLPFFGTMPSDLPCTIVLDVSKFPAAASRVEISSAIVNRFTAYKVNAVQFVGKQAIPRNLEVDGYHCKVSYYGQAKECDICEKTGHIAKDCPSGENV